MSWYNWRRKVPKAVLWLCQFLNFNDNFSFSQSSFEISWNQWFGHLYYLSDSSVFCWLDIWSYFHDSRIKNSTSLECSQSGAKFMFLLHYRCIHTSNRKNEWALSSHHLYILQHSMFDYNVHYWAAEKILIRKKCCSENNRINKNNREWKFKWIKWRIIVLIIRMTHYVNWFIIKIYNIFS